MTDIRRCWLVVALILAAMLFALCSSAEAQQATKIQRIGYLSGSSPSTSANRREAFQQGLHELGYVEGKNIVIEWRWAHGKFDRLPALAAELVRLKVDVIVTTGPQATRPTKQTTSTIPIVMAQDPDPVGNGFVASLAQPGGNITGLSSLAPELSGKQLELLKEIVPNLSRVAVFGTSINPGNAQNLREVELAARTFGVKLQYLDILSSNDVELAFRAASNGNVSAVLMLPGSVLVLQRAQLADLAAKNQLPAIYPQPEFTEAGGLMYYGANTRALFHRAATYVDKILKGAKPAELPVEQPQKFEFIINLKAAKRIGLTISQKVLARADRVIK
jgi:ABC-type uncharacterized transport system substrate-binding protein